MNVFCTVCEANVPASQTTDDPPADNTVINHVTTYHPDKMFKPVFDGDVLTLVEASL